MRRSALYGGGIAFVENAKMFLRLNHVGQVMARPIKVAKIG